MALKQIGGSFLPWPTPPTDGNPGAQAEGSLVMDAVDEACATVCQVPKTGTISKIGFRTNPVGAAAAVTVSLEEVDLSTGEPSGTLVSSGVTGTVAVSSADTWYEVTLGTAWTEANGCVRGKTFAVVITNPGTGSPDVDIAVFIDDDGRDFPYSLEYAPSTWTKSKGSMMAALEYSDGSYEWIPGCVPMEGLAGVTFNNTDTINYVGNRFRLPFPCMVAGFWVWHVKSANYTIQLQADAEDATGTVLGAVTAADGPGDSNLRASSNGQLEYWLLNSGIELSKDTWYRLTAKPESASDVTLYGGGVNGTIGTPLMEAMPGGLNLYKTDWDTSGGPAWVDTVTAFVWMGLLISHFDDGVGGGGGGSINRGILTGGRL